MFNAKSYAASKRKGYRSGLEVEVQKQLAEAKLDVGYETIKIEWEDLAYRKYTPDFVLPNGVIIETKGLFTPSDRRKHILIQKQHPELDIRFIFTNSNKKLNKKSKTTYAKWCEKYNFLYATKVIPEDWLDCSKKVEVPKLINFKGIKHYV